MNIVESIFCSIENNINNYSNIHIMRDMEEKLLELYGLILGDGSFSFNRGKHPNMKFYNFNLKLAKHVKKICEEITKKKIKISSRQRKTGIEYTVNIPIEVVRKLLKLGFNKNKLPDSIIHNPKSIFLLKGMYESEGSCNGSQVYISQKNNESVLEGLRRIANAHNLGAHIHNLNREGEQYLVVEDVNRVKKLFGKCVKPLKPFKRKINGYYTTKRLILNFLNDGKWKKTSEIYAYLKKNKIK